ncbi:MAG: hypothetical protein QM710_09455 [Flavobacterium sp.]
MNIIALLEQISLDKSKIGILSREDFAQIKQQLTELRELNPEVGELETEQLLKALKSHPDTFQAVLNNRILFNFFTKKDLARKHFTNEHAAVENEKVRSFVQAFFGEELNLFFNQNLDANTFAEISSLAEAHNYLPDHLNFSLRQHSLDKLDDAIVALKPPYGNLSKVLYIRDGYFFAFLNQIKNEEIELKVTELFDTVSNFLRQDPNSELANKTFLAMNNYNALDPEFSKKIKSRKEFADTKFDAHIRKRKNLTWLYVLVGVVVFARIVFFISMKSKQYDYDTYEDQDYNTQEVYNEQPRQIDKYYTNMKQQIDSFQVFLTNFKNSEVKQLKQDIALKTGDNPFENFLSKPTGRR